MFARMTILVLLLNFLAMTYANANTYMVRRHSCGEGIQNFLKRQASKGYQCSNALRPVRQQSAMGVSLSYVFECAKRSHSFLAKLELDMQSCTLAIIQIDSLEDAYPVPQHKATKPYASEAVE